jgi:protein gp37
MGDKTGIQWTDATWNPTTGCTKISPGCKNCYADRQSTWRRAQGLHKYRNGFELTLQPGCLAEVMKWTQPKLVFVNSMSDLFHEGVPVDFIAAVCDVMRVTPWHTYQVLTKRHERQQELLNDELSWAGALPNVIWGVSVEDVKYGVPRIDVLRNTSAMWRMLSIEPLLEDIGKIDLDGIDWVIVGGESGPGWRPMKDEWVYPILDQCRKAGVAFFFKQHSNPPKNGYELGGKLYKEFPPIPMADFPTLEQRKILGVALRKFGELWETEHANTFGSGNS